MTTLPRVNQRKLQASLWQLAGTADAFRGEEFIIDTMKFTGKVFGWPSSVFWTAKGQSTPESYEALWSDYLAVAENAGHYVPPSLYRLAFVTLNKAENKSLTLPRLISEPWKCRPVKDFVKGAFESDTVLLKTRVLGGRSGGMVLSSSDKAADRAVSAACGFLYIGLAERNSREFDVEFHSGACVFVTSYKEWLRLATK